MQGFNAVHRIMPVQTVSYEPKKTCAATAPCLKTLFKTKREDVVGTVAAQMGGDGPHGMDGGARGWHGRVH